MACSARDPFVIAVAAASMAAGCGDSMSNSSSPDASSPADALAEADAIDPDQNCLREEGVPPGARLAYAVDLSEWSRDHIYLGDFSTADVPGCLGRVTETTSLVDYIAWSPDGSKIAFGGVYVDVVDVSTPNPGTPHAVLEYPSAASFDLFRWTPDSAHIAWWGVGEDPDERALFTVGIRPGSTPVRVHSADESVSRPSWSPTNDGRVAYTASDGLYLADVTSADPPTRLDTLADAAEIVWAPDGSALAYVDAPNHLAVTVVDLSGKEPAKPQRVSHDLTVDGEVGALLWSPDATHLLYAAFEDGANNFFVAPRDASTEAMTINAEPVPIIGILDKPRYGWVSGHVAFYLADEVEESNAAGQELYLVDVDEPNTRIPAAPNLPLNERWHWSPDRHHLLFTTQFFDGQSAWETMYHLEVNGTDVAPPNEVAMDLSLEGDLRWSPNSRYVAFAANTEADSWIRVWLLDTAPAGGPILRNLGDAPPVDRRFAWSADSRHLAFPGWYEGGRVLWYADPDSTEQAIRITDPVLVPGESLDGVADLAWEL